MEFGFYPGKEAIESVFFVCLLLYTSTTATYYYCHTITYYHIIVLLFYYWRINWWWWWWCHSCGSSKHTFQGWQIFAGWWNKTVFPWKKTGVEKIILPAKQFCHVNCEAICQNQAYVGKKTIQEYYQFLPVFYQFFRIPAKILFAAA